MADVGVTPADPFLLKYQPAELQIASEFLATWLPFLSRDLCQNCTQILSDRIRFFDPEVKVDAEPVCSEHNFNVSTPNYTELNASDKVHDDDDGTNSLGSWKDAANGWSESVPEASAREKVAGNSPAIDTLCPPMSWADMAQEEDELGEEEDKLEEEEDELEEEEDELEVKEQLVNVNGSTDLRISKLVETPKLSREQRENIRFRNVNRKKDFICLERINGKIVNILEGLELHTGIFSALEQKRIVDYISMLQEKGRKGELRAKTFTAPQKWMRGKGRVTIQFGCCYNYAPDRHGNPPGILPNEEVDPMPHLFKVIIRRLVRWHVLPPTCVPDSCIVNIYEEGDCIPPHIDNHDFVRPFCTLSFLSKCNILFGSNLKVVRAGEFEGPMAIPLPVGSVLVLNGKGADVAKHCVPAVPTKRISITFRRMDDSKRPIGFVPEPDLQGIQPLVLNEVDVDQTKRPNPPKSEHHEHQVRRVGNRYAPRFSEGPDTHPNPRYSNWNRRGPPNRGRFQANIDR